MIQPVFEMSETGLIRLSLFDTLSGLEIVAGEWAGYTSIATVTYKDVTYVAVSEYFAGVLPAEQALAITPVEGGTKRYNVKT